MEKVIKLSVSFFKVHYLPFVLGGSLLTLFLPYLVGVQNLDVMRSAFVVERFFSLIGLLLFIPLFIPDVNRDTLTIIRTKETNYWYILCIRLIVIVIFTTALTIVYLLILRFNQAQFPFLSFFFGTLAIVTFLGGLSNFIFSLSKQPILGMMAGLIYYVVNMSASRQHLGPFYLFNLAQTDWQPQLFLFTIGCALLVLSVIYASSSNV